MFKPLAGVKVVDFTLAGSGPAGTGILAQQGADVIWVEPLAGNSTRTIHELNYYCSGKRSITLDLKSPEGLEAMLRLIRDADVFCTNYRMKSVKKLGLGYDDLKAVNPRIIYASLTGWGDVGPKANDAGFDTVCFWARGGMLQDFAEKGTLLVPPVAVGDIHTGESLALGITSALYAREKTGEGCELSTSILMQAVFANHDAIIESQYGEEYPKSRLSPRRAMLNSYRCKDGKWVVISSTYFERHFDKLLKILGREDLIGDPRWTCIEDTMYEKAPELVKIFDEGFAKLTQDEAVAALTEIDLAVERAASTADIIHDPQVLENGYLRKYTDPKNGKTVSFPIMSPVRFGPEPEMGNYPRAPYLGEHSAEVLRGIGYSQEEIDALLAKGVTSVTDTEYTINI